MKSIFIFSIYVKARNRGDYKLLAKALKICYTLRMNLDISAVAFDIDGTLYPAWKFNIRILPFVLKNYKLMTSLNKARNQIRKMQAGEQKIITDDFLLFKQSC